MSALTIYADTAPSGVRRSKKPTTTDSSIWRCVKQCYNAGSWYAVAHNDGESGARKDAEAKRIADAQHAADAARQAKEDHPCDTMWTYQKAGVSAYNNDSFQSAYDASVSGLHYAYECDNDDAKTVAKGYLLVTKALSEKHLSSGDSEVDINRGITLLASCQGTPGLYATEIAARCEKEEDIAIRYKMQWEEDRYSSN
jgi:hypothetical protein